MNPTESPASRCGAARAARWPLLLLAIVFLAACGESEPQGSRGTSATRPGSDALVVYCAHDRVYSEQVLEAFTRATGIPVRAKYDTELTKSLGLVEQILAERPDAGQGDVAAGGGADVFWNNEPLGTMDLADAGRLEAWKGAAWERAGAKWRDEGGRWVGFGGRARTWIVYHPSMGRYLIKFGPDAAEASDPVRSFVRALVRDPSLSRVTIADPMFGTTRMHYTVLWRRFGAERVRQWHEDAAGRGLVRSRSNGQTKNIVANGKCDAGWTDSDDYFEVAGRGLPVEHAPVTIPRDVEGRDDPPADFWQSPRDTPSWTIIVPNTVAIIRGTPRAEAARRFVDWLASEEGEILLANSAAHQIPLGPVKADRLPATVAGMLPLVEDAYPVSDLAGARAECLAWIKSWKR